MNFPPLETESLISALRDELQDCGALLHLLEARHRPPRGQTPDVEQQLSEDIVQRRSEVLRSRKRRQGDLLRLVGAPEPGSDPDGHISLEALLPYFPPTVAPMIQGLVQEINSMIARVDALSGDERKRQDEILTA